MKNRREKTNQLLHFTMPWSYPWALYIEPNVTLDLCNINL